jgi:phage gp36-like protein
MAYFELSDLEALIPPTFLTQALDDDADGEIDAFTAVQAQACRMVDEILESRFSVPFNPVPNKIKGAAVLFACWLCYARRGTPEKDNPFDRSKSGMEKKLEKIEAGDLGLSVAPTAQQPAEEAGSILSWESPLGSPNRTLG